MTDDSAAAFSLLNAAAVRMRAKRMLALGLDDTLPHFRIDLARLDDAVDLVVATTKKNYPTLDVPFHSRWRHFVVGGKDRSEAVMRPPPFPPRKRRRIGEGVERNGTRGPRSRRLRSGHCQRPA